MTNQYNYNTVECTNCDFEGESKDLEVIYRGEDCKECCPNCNTHIYLKSID